MSSKSKLVWLQGQTVWVPHKDAGYTTGTIMSISPKGELAIRLDVFEKMITIKPEEYSDIEPVSVDKQTLINTDDLTALPDLHRPSLLDALNQRFLKDKIYTYTGHILIAVNPFKDLPIYSPQLMLDYFHASATDHLPPHAYRIANNAFLDMMDFEGKNQSILVSGESGAGKTVTTKIVLDYLTFVSSKRGGQTTMKKVEEARSVICEKVLQSNPLLEAFGNAKTLRNDNSSRFGKYIQLQFDFSKLLGCEIDTYLLEVTRVMHHAKGERNFHIFYELHYGLTEAEKAKLDMPHIDDTIITNAHDRSVVRSDIADAKQWLKTLEAMKVVGLNDNDINNLKKLVVAVMHLGDLSFTNVVGSTDDSSQVSANTKNSLISAAKLLEVSAEELERAMCSRIITFKNTELVKVHNVEQAIEARNAIAMALYERTFLWLVWRVNKSMANEVLSAKVKVAEKKIGKYVHASKISILDIFGFEVFDTENNRMMTLLINHANSVLQALFNEFVFVYEQQIYESEGIDWTKISFPDNSESINVVEDKKVGILKMLDDECLTPKGGDSGFHEKISSVVAKKFPAVISVDNGRQKMQKFFTIKHFAGDVEYTSEGFCLRNKNELRQEQVGCIRSSGNKFFQTLLPPDAAKASGAATTEYFDEIEADLEKLSRAKDASKIAAIEAKHARVATKETQRLQQSTVGNNFKNELDLAIQKIKASELHFVRCIKPNDRNVSDDLDTKRALEQLNYSGVLEAVKISRLGYSSRFMFIEFFQRFKILLPINYPKVKGNSRQNNAFKSSCLDILELNSMIKFDDYQLGNSKVFLKADAFAKLESMKREKQSKSVLVAQRAARTFIFRLTIKRRIKQRKLREEEERRKQLALQQKDQVELTKVIVVEPPKEEIPVPPPRPARPSVKTSNTLKKSVDDDETELDQDLMSIGNATKHTFERDYEARSQPPVVAVAAEENPIMMLAEHLVNQFQEQSLTQLAQDEGPMLGALLTVGGAIFFSIFGFDSKALVKFMLLVVCISAGLLFIVEWKMRLDRQKFDNIYRVPNKPMKKVSNNTMGYEDEDLDGGKNGRLRAGSKRSMSSKSIKRASRRGLKKSSSKHNLVSAGSRRSIKNSSSKVGASSRNRSKHASSANSRKIKGNNSTMRGTEVGAGRGRINSSESMNSNNNGTLRSGRFRGMSMRLQKDNSAANKSFMKSSTEGTTIKKMQ